MVTVIKKLWVHKLFWLYEAFNGLYQWHLLTLFDNSLESIKNQIISMGC
jgi:hypothetical protein